MKFPGAIYKTSRAEYLAVYNHWPDISVQLPPDLSSGRHVGHVDYSYGARTKGIDIFSFEGGVPKVSKHLNVDKGFGYNHNQVVGVFDNGKRRVDFLSGHTGIVTKHHDIHFTFIEGQGTGEVDELVALTAADVSTYCVGRNSNPAKHPTGTTLNQVQRIIPITTLERVITERNGKPYILTGGKAEFVKACILNANIDFGGGCIAGWVPGEDASFDGTTFVNFFLAPWSECRYPCYAIDKHSSFPKNLLNLDPALLKKELMGDCCLDFGSDIPYGKPIPILRFGKRTETGSKYTRDLLLQTLEIMTETKTRGVIPTKFLEFDPTVADLLRRTKSAVLFSRGLDEEEPGAVAHGCTNEWRFEQAMKYREAGVNANLYLLVRGHLPPEERELAILEKARYGSKIPIQVLPFVTKSKEAAERLLGLPWDLLKGKKGQKELPDFVNPYAGSYYLDGGKLRVQRLNPAWRALAKDYSGISICHHDPFETDCGGCGHCPKRTCQTEEQVRVPRIRNNKRKAQKKKASEPVDTKQLTFI